ncbi:MAG: trehalose-6-phosphate synthase, partial [Burkholderiaceae bacterium]|nr:trehalose-6-phosphate synthase [Burkholderiaceae bacterium]
MRFKTLRLQLRFLLPLVATLAIAAYLAVHVMDGMTLHWFSRDVNSRGRLVATALSDSVADAIDSGRIERLRPLFDRTVQG